MGDALQSRFELTPALIEEQFLLPDLFNNQTYGQKEWDTLVTKWDVRDPRFKSAIISVYELKQDKDKTKLENAKRNTQLQLDRWEKDTENSEKDRKAWMLYYAMGLRLFDLPPHSLEMIYMAVGKLYPTLAPGFYNSGSPVDVKEFRPERKRIRYSK